jgi:hypothetical protein
MSLDNDYTPGEAEYFSTGDERAVRAEAGHQPAPPEPAGDSDYSDAERHFFETGGDVTPQLP